MKTFSETLRYEYPLSPDDWVIDGGAYQGVFSHAIASRYLCNVLALEPIRRFYGQCVDRLKDFPKVVVKNAGISDRSRPESFAVRNDSSGQFSPSDEIETVLLIGVREALGIIENRGFESRIALLKLNIEGGEFSVLEEVLRAGLAHRFKNIQVQNHLCVPHAEERWKRIEEGLAQTHHLTYCEPWVWSNFELTSP